MCLSIAIYLHTIPLGSHTSCSRLFSAFLSTHCSCSLCQATPRYVDVISNLGLTEDTLKFKQFNYYAKGCHESFLCDEVYFQVEMEKCWTFKLEWLIECHHNGHSLHWICSHFSVQTCNPEKVMPIKISFWKQIFFSSLKV